MKYCSACGAEVRQRVPEGDDRPRHVCDACDMIHYINPRIIVGCLVEHDSRVLLCRRAIEPRANLWTLPAGFMENGETTVQGAVRETWEEARAKVEGEQLYRLFDIPRISQVYMFYRARLVNGAYAVGPESNEVALFDEQDIPWDEIAFPVVHHTLRDYFDDRRRGHWPVTVSTIPRR